MCRKQQMKGVLEGVFDEFIQYYYVVPIFSILLVIISFWINNRDATSLENKLMTNFKKLQIFCSTIFIETIMIGIVLFVLIYINNDLPEYMVEESKGVNIESTLPFIIALVLVSFGLSLVLHTSLLITKKLFSVKTHYFVKLSDSTIKWYLVRLSNNKQILLMNNDVEYIFLNEWAELVFKAELMEFTKFQKLIYSSEKKINLISISLLCSTIAIYIFFVFFELDLVEIFIMMFAMVLLLSICVWLNQMKKIIFKNE